jgi:hypothetical protein
MDDGYGYAADTMSPSDLLRIAGDNADDEPGERGEKGESHSKTVGSDGRSQGDKGRVGANDGVKADLLAKARRSLRIETPHVPDYPTSALGPLTDVTRAIAEGAQLPAGIAGQSVLSTVALLAQSRANVRSLDGNKPTSLYALTIAGSGDGKTTADSTAQSAVQKQQREAARQYLRDLDEWDGASKKDRGPPPREPYRVARDGTVEGIRRGFAHGIPSQAVFSSEAAAMLNGYGMTPEQRSKTAATLNAMWDDGELSVSRSLTGRIQLYDRRLSIHWMIQPTAVESVLNDSSLSAMGFWPRFLVSWPDPSPPRKARPWDAAKDATIAAFWRRCTLMMEGPILEDCSTLRVLEMTPEATGLLGQFFERMDYEGKVGGLIDVGPFAFRAAEQAARIAGVLAEFVGDREIKVETIRHGIALASYSLEVWRGIFGDRDRATANSSAERLFKWLLNQPGWTADETAILRIGPKTLRSQDKRDTALAVLHHARLIFREGRNWTVEATT